jgi:hypothetical protein
MTQLPEGFPEGMQVPTDEQIASYVLFRDEQNAYIAAKEQTEADRQAILATPLAPLPIDGSTVSEVKASAEASIADLAVQMEAKIQAISGQ